MADPETDTNNNDGNGKKTVGGEIITAAIAAVAAAVAAALISLGNKVFGPRSVVVSMMNFTSAPLTKITDHHESGGFATNPKLEIPGLGNDTLISKSTDPFQGAIGSVTYAGNGITLLVGWDNPRIGDNKTNHTLDGPNKSRFLVQRETGSGDENAQALFVISPHAPYQLKGSLAGLGQTGLSIGLAKVASELGKSGRPISVRDLVNY